MSTCSVCNKDFEDEYFDVEQNKCILHCEKHEKNYWFAINKNNKIEWHTDKVILFWKKINNEIEAITDAKINNIEISEEMIKEYNYEHFKYKFKKVIFPMSIPDSPDYISFHKLNCDIDINFIECEFLSFVDFSLLNKAKNINFSECKFFSSIIFENMKFDNQFFLESCVVHDNMNFVNIVFTNITSFMNSEFYKELNFMHSRFDDLAIFNGLKGGTLFLGNTFFRKEANFLSMNIGVHDRETARIIKNSFEQQNNIIEANKFYALEMKEREKELNKDIKEGKNIFEWLIFKAHAISSNHSQDWLLALLWILNIAFIFSMFTSTFHHNNMLAYISIFIVVISSTFNNTLLKIALGINLIIASILSYIYLDVIADKINPFSIMTSKDPITFGLLMFKITIAYLIYQFIVSVRQNTRRK
ncbi:MAG: hypothetical protein C0627_05765 [Sulfurimonas sp.]|nr:MAG: hypothetical protein C0627_05765 [Sulfurimonas sp.]